MGSFRDIDTKITVGVIDSFHSPEAVRDDDSVFARSLDLLTDCDVEDTTGHGIEICQVLTDWSPSIEINLYRVTQPGGDIWGRHLLDALGYAHKRDQVDVINMSVGNDHSTDGNPGCAAHNQPCALRKAVKEAVGDGIPVVAAAGNSSQYNSVCCPSLCEMAISVGGVLSKCTYTPPIENSQRELSARPPLSCWSPNDDEFDIEFALCSGEDCMPHPDVSCEECRRTENWSGNVNPVRNKPDILAPAATISTGDNPYTKLGTSFATPIVTAWVAEVMAAVRERGINPPAYVFRQSLEETGSEVEGRDLLMNGREAMKKVFDKVDLPRPKTGVGDDTQLGSGISK
jgi:subtilisin family serine protease